MFPGPPHPTPLSPTGSRGPRAPGVHLAQRATLWAGRLRPRRDPHGHSCANDHWGKAANAKVLQGAGHADTLPPGAALPARVPRVPRTRRQRPEDGTDLPRCTAGQQRKGLDPGQLGPGGHAPHTVTPASAIGSFPAVSTCYVPQPVPCGCHVSPREAGRFQGSREGHGLHRGCALTFRSGLEG